MVKGVIFDFDGTIVDSEKSRLESLNIVLKDFNYKILEQDWNLNYRRLRSIVILEHIKNLKGFDYNSNLLYEKSHKIREKLESEGVRIVKGFLEFYNFLKKNNIKTIIASGGRREHIRFIMGIEKLPSIEIIGREDYERVKPFPDCYNLALKKLNLNSKDVIIFDDSVTGIEAGISAGCRVIAINCYDFGVDDLNIYRKVKDYTELEFNSFLDN